MSDLVSRLREAAEEEKQARIDAEFGPGGGNPDAKAEDALEWEAAERIAELEAVFQEIIQKRDAAYATYTTREAAERVCNEWERYQNEDLVDRVRSVLRHVDSNSDNEGGAKEEEKKTT